LRLCVADLAFGSHLVELGTNPVDRLRCRVGAGVKQSNRVPGAGRDLGNASAHGTCADDGNDGLR
jgi:hypothetical protein